jgi:transcriptional regulator with XRE-family HTH domain
MPTNLVKRQRGIHLTLRTLREAAGKTQQEVGEAAQINQADVSRLESRDTFDDCQVSTLQRYIAALGGQLELVAAFGDKRIILTGPKSGPSAAPEEAPRRPARPAARR